MPAISSSNAGAISSRIKVSTRDFRFMMGVRLAEWFGIRKIHHGGTPRLSRNQIGEAQYRNFGALKLPVHKPLQ
jgi:hypothetical protein